MTSLPPSEPAKEPQTPQLRPELARHILNSSCTMIGMCATLVGLVKFLESQTSETLVDEYAALVGIVFLGSAILSYISIRNTSLSRLSYHLERAADILFVMGLIGIASAVAFLAFEII